MGRPKKELSELRIVQINVRVTAEEFCKVAANAESLGLSITEYIRRKSTKKSLPTKKISPLDRKLFIALSRMGNNLNQLAKVANSGIQDPLGIAKELTAVKRLINDIKAHITNNDR
ncbi:plasmid mobilization protein [Flagellimonas onchidii]|uniref:plasmid mobilization protein n=1 Tax=Flagellimonas onchidii TaxID=2562684 RepID=UPI0010A5DDCF|nr:plasmid mobilization relaxosome protein MobC [Allomuricauda onchidii]